MFTIDDAARKRLLQDALVEHLLEGSPAAPATLPAPAVPANSAQATATASSPARAA
jgi:hypothetical protein